MIAVTPVLRPAAAGPASGGLEQFGLKPGDTITAKVLALLPDGNVRVAIAGQEIQLTSSAVLRPGADVLLRAEREGQLLKLLLVSSIDPKPAASSEAPLQVRTPQTAITAEIQRQAQAQIVRGLGDGAVQASPQQQPALKIDAAATLEHYLQYGRPAAGAPGQGAATLSPQQRSVFASIANGFADLAAGGNPVLPEVLRQTAARLLSLPSTVRAPAQPLANAPAESVSFQGGIAPSAAQDVQTAQPALVPRDAVAVLFSSLARVIARDEGSLPPALRQAAARLLDLPAPPPVPEQELSAAGVARVAVASASALFDVAARFVSAPQNLPDAVRSAIQQVLGLRLPVTETASSDGLQNAVKASGLLHEALLLRAAPGSPPPPDLKAALLVLRNVLQSWTGAQPSSHNKAAFPQAPGQGFAEQPAEVQALARSMLHQAEAHLARLRLAQFAATPDRNEAGQAARTDAADMSGQIPIIDGPRTTLLQFHIEREAAPPEGEERPAWSVRFSFDFEATGYTHALVVLRGSKVRVRLRAERRDTFNLFNANEQLLRALFEEAELQLDNVETSLIGARPDAIAEHEHVDRLT